MTIRIKVAGPFMTVEAVDVLTEGDLRPLLAAFDAAYRAGPFVVLTDTTQMKSAPTPVLYAFADGLKRMPSMSKVWLGNGVVVKSAATRFVVSTLLIVAPMPTEVKAFDKAGEARHWCAGLLLREGMNVPPQMLKSA